MGEWHEVGMQELLGTLQGAYPSAKFKLGVDHENRLHIVPDNLHLDASMQLALGNADAQQVMEHLDIAALGDKVFVWMDEAFEPGLLDDDEFSDLFQDETVTVPSEPAIEPAVEPAVVQASPQPDSTDPEASAVLDQVEGLMKRIGELEEQVKSEEENISYLSEKIQHLTTENHELDEQLQAAKDEAACLDEFLRTIYEQCGGNLDDLSDDVLERADAMTEFIKGKLGESED